MRTARGEPSGWASGVAGRVSLPSFLPHHPRFPDTRLVSQMIFQPGSALFVSCVIEAGSRSPGSSALEGSVVSLWLGHSFIHFFFFFIVM